MDKISRMEREFLTKYKGFFGKTYKCGICSDCRICEGDDCYKKPCKICEDSD